MDSYVVYPTGFAEFVNSDADAWCLTVTDGHEWGWSVRRGIGVHSPMAMNRSGAWVAETRGSRNNKARRFSRVEALRIALAHVDTHRVNGCTAAEASAQVAQRIASRRALLGDDPVVMLPDHDEHQETR